MEDCNLENLSNKHETYQKKEDTTTTTKKMQTFCILDGAI